MASLGATLVNDRHGATTMNTHINYLVPEGHPALELLEKDYAQRAEAAAGLSK